MSDKDENRVKRKLAGEANPDTGEPKMKKTKTGKLQL